MKRIWTVISILALANVLALGGLVGWLKATDRLSKDRMIRLRELFQPTIAQERKATEEAEAKRAEDAAKAAEEAKSQRPPINAADRLELSAQGEEVRRQQLASLEKQVDLLRASLARDSAEVARSRDQLNQDQAAFEAMRKRVLEQEGSAQFKKTLTTLQDLKPDQAKKAMKEMIAMTPAPTGSASTIHTGMDLVVSYLNSMDGRARVKVVNEFIQDDPKLAADLLERLRTRGLAFRAPEVSPNDRQR
ncbi:MAG: hypothetical protein KF691_10970 [Phycisphaeraceae bacterium]|nr:hypothetical protein [Phycisphaeraceae bacterium]